jgi:hypothetical protein
MNRYCPACGVRALPFGRLLLMHRWRPAICPNCGSAVGLDRAACLRALVLPGLTTLLYFLCAYYFIKHSNRFALSIFALVMVASILIWLHFAYQMLWRIPLQKSEK